MKSNWINLKEDALVKSLPLPQQGIDVDRLS